MWALFLSAGVIAQSLPTNAQDALERAEEASATGDAHYSHLAVWVTPLRTQTVVDEVWRDSAGRWRLERSSDGWDNDLIAVDDGTYLTVTSPNVSVTLRVSKHAQLDFVSPQLFRDRPSSERFTFGTSGSVLGQKALILHAKTNDYEVRRWISQSTFLPLKEERLDKMGRPTLVVVRQELDPDEPNPRRFALQVDKVTSDVNKWRHAAILTWCQKQLPFRLPFSSDKLPSWVRIEWVGVREEKDGPTAVLVATAGDQLVSVWMTKAKAGMPPKRPLLALGHAVLRRRVGDVDIVIVGSSERKALAFFKQVIARSK